MKIIRIGGAIVGLLAAFFVAGLVLLPKHLHVAQHADIDAPISVVFNHVNDLSLGEAWNPWKANDPTMTWTLGETTVGNGARYTWTSENSGEGIYDIKLSQKNTEVQTHVQFGDMGEGFGTWTFERLDHDSDEATPDVTRATWAFDADMGMFGGYVNLFMGPTLEADFIQGLGLLKTVTEAWAPPPPPPPPEPVDTDPADTDAADTDPAE